MSGGLWPFWERDGLYYQVAGFSTLNPDNVTVIHLKSIDGRLDESVRYTDLNLFNQFVDREKIDELLKEQDE